MQISIPVPGGSMTLAELAEQHQLHKQEYAEWDRKLEASRQYWKQLVKKGAAKTSALKASSSALMCDTEEYCDIIRNGISNSHFEGVAVQVNPLSPTRTHLHNWCWLLSSLRIYLLQSQRFATDQKACSLE